MHEINSKSSNEKNHKMEEIFTQVVVDSHLAQVDRSFLLGLRLGTAHGRIACCVRRPYVV